MILFDMSNIVFSTVLDYHEKTREQMTPMLLRALVIGKLITEKNKHKGADDEIVFCFDSRRYWRKEQFKYYKAKRKEDREKSTFDWDTFFMLYDQLKQDFRDYFPVKCIEVDGAEADDVMAILAMRYGPLGNVVIVSADKDLIQIQDVICPKVKQYSPYHKKFLTPATKGYSLFEHVVRGDVDDGVPNILSDDDVIVTPGARQRPLKTADVERWKKYGLDQPEHFCKDAAMLDRFVRNRNMIDLRRIPDELAQRIVEAYDAAVPVKGKLFTYFTANRLGRILSQGGW